MSLTGTLGIDIRISNGNGVTVTFTPARQVDTGKLFAGKPWPEAAKLARLMFAVCGNGQAIALAMASQAAAGMKVSEVSMQARSMLVCAEALREHTSRIFMDWPQLLGDAPKLDDMLEVVRGYTALQNNFHLDTILDGTADVSSVLRASASELAAIIRRKILSGKFDVPDRLVARCNGNSQTGAMENDGTVLGRRDHDARLTGSGLERRIRARLLEVDLICDWLENPEQPCPLEFHAERTGDDTGMAEVEVARGLLRHEIRLDGEIVVGCLISAPTSANFMDGGTAEKAILALDLTDRTQFEWQARLAMLEVDPCVAHEVRVS